VSQDEGNAVMYTGAGVRQYCSEARTASRADAINLAEGYRELRKTLRPLLGWRRSHLVAWQLRYAAEHAKQASAHSGAAYISFLKHFQPEVFGRLPKGRRRYAGSRSDFFKR